MSAVWPINIAETTIPKIPTETAKKHSRSVSGLILSAFITMKTEFRDSAYLVKKFMQPFVVEVPGLPSSCAERSEAHF